MLNNSESGNKFYHGEVFGGEGEPKMSGKRGKGGGFQCMNLSMNTLKGVLRKGYKVPTPIQRKAILPILDNQNVIAMARTGSGKTAAFLIPVIQKLESHSQLVGTRALILSPTRELVLQTARFFREFAKFTSLRICVLVGSSSMETQFEFLAQNPDLIVATPGRLFHHLKESEFSLAKLEMVVYDEADRLFDPEFREQISYIKDKIPNNTQTLFFSATIPPELSQFASGLTQKEYKILKIDKECKLSDKLRIIFYSIPMSQKIGALIWLLGELPKSETKIVFVATRYHVEFLCTLFTLFRGEGWCVGIYGNMEPELRNHNFYKFRSRGCKILIVTDLAARGLDIPYLDNVIHYDFTTTPKLFIHRSGRTARAGQTGICYALISPDERAYMYDISLHISRAVNNSSAARSIQQIDTDKIYYGRTPPGLLEPYILIVNKLMDEHPELEGLRNSMVNGFKKFQKTRKPASKASVERTKEIPISEIKIHPLLLTAVGKEELERIDFVKSLQNFKPMVSVVKKNTTFIPRLKPEAKDQNTQDMEDIMGNVQNLPTKEIPMMVSKKEKVDIPNEELQLAGLKRKIRPKSRYKIKGEITQKRAKRGQMSSFLDSRSAISAEPKTGEEEIKEIWGSEIPIQMSELSMNVSLTPGDDSNFLLQKKRKMQWDANKKNYVMKPIDGDGNIIPDSHKTLQKKKDTGKTIYQKWKKSSHLRIQGVEEMEDPNVVGNAKNSFANRRQFGNMGGRRSFVKDEIKNPFQLLKEKKAKNKLKTKSTKGKGNALPKKFEKAYQKMVERSRPTKSKLIVKGNKRK